MSIKSAIDKLHQAFNLVLAFSLIAVTAGVFIFFLTTPEERGTTFWISMVSLAFALILGLLFSSKVALSDGREAPGNFSHLVVVAAYFIFVVGASIANVYLHFSTTTYFLIHIGGAAAFLLPLLLIHMAMLKPGGADRRDQRGGRLSLSLKASHLQDLVKNLEFSLNLPGEDFSPLLRLAASLQYADPTPASRSTENVLIGALSALDGAVAALTNGTEADRVEKWQAVLAACHAAESALKQRNMEVINAK